MPPSQPVSAGVGRRPNRLFSVVLLAGALAAAGTAGTLVAARSAIDEVPRVPGVAGVLCPPRDTVENFLLVGSDSRAGADPDSPDAGGIGSETDVTGSRSDTIMVLRRDKATGVASLLSIPRDLWVEIPGRGSSRINSAYNDGPAVLVQTVQTALGVPIHHYVEVDFFGFKDLVEAIGGVEMCFDYPARDEHTGLYVAEPGCHVLDGVQALAYARSRYYEEFREDGEWHIDGTADIGRTKRQQRFVNVALNTAITKVTTNPFVAGEVLSSTTSAVRLDDELDLLAAASSLRGAVQDGLETWSLPVRGDTIDGMSVLQLADGSQAVLDYFRGVGPVPAPQA
jgi:LCP family protein required for cell wall assembly